MKNSYFSDTLQVLLKNRCEVCEKSEKSLKANTDAGFKEMHNLTPSGNHGVRNLKNLTHLTPAHIAKCESFLEKKDNKINILDDISHTSHVSHQKNINTCNRSKIDTERLRIFLEEDWEDYKDNQEALNLWSILLAESQLMRQNEVPSN